MRGFPSDDPQEMSRGHLLKWGGHPSHPHRPFSPCCPPRTRLAVPIEHDLLAHFVHLYNLPGLRRPLSGQVLIKGALLAAEPADRGLEVLPQLQGYRGILSHLPY